MKTLEPTVRRCLGIWWSQVWRAALMILPLQAAIMLIAFGLGVLTKDASGTGFSFLGMAFGALAWLGMIVAMIYVQGLAMRMAFRVKRAEYSVVLVANEGGEPPSQP